MNSCITKFVLGLLFQLLGFIVIIWTEFIVVNCFSSTKVAAPTNNFSNQNKTTVKWPWEKKKSRYALLNEPFVSSDITVPITNLLEKIDSDMIAFNTSRPLSQSKLEMLRENQTFEWIYHSNSIEGLSTNLTEIKTVLEGLTGSCKSHEEFFAILNHRDAIQYITEIIQKKEKLTEFQIRNIHSILLMNIKPTIAGSYRESDVFIRGAKTDPPASTYVPALMGTLINWHNHADQMHPIIRAAILHTRFVMIHPFLDGNGRTGRLIMNYDIMKYGYPPAVISVNDRPSYYKAIENACNNNFSDIIWLVANSVQNSLELYLKCI